MPRPAPLRCLTAAAIALTALPLAGPLPSGPPTATAASSEYPPGTGMRGFRIYDLSGGSVGFRQMYASDISDTGTVVGSIVNDDNSFSPFAWAPGSPWEQLDQDTSVNAWATAVSPDGVVVGNNFEYEDSAHRSYVTEWTRGEIQFGPMRRVTDLGEADEVVRRNDAGQVLVRSRIPMVIDAAGGRTELALELPAGASDPQAGVFDLNASGQVAGSVGYDPDGFAGPRTSVTYPAVWTGGTPTPLPLPPGATQGYAKAIDAHGHVAVSSGSPTGSAWLYLVLLVRGAFRI